MLEEGRALEVVGISAFDERVYRGVLACPGITVQELVRRSGESAGRIQSSLSRLRAKGLVSRLWGRSPRWTATNPGAAIRSLVRGMQGELDRLTDTADELEAAFRTVGQGAEEGGQLEVLAGPEEQARWYVRLQQEAKEEVLTFDRPPYVLDYHNPLQTGLLRSGVRYRTIYVPEAFDHTGALDEVGSLIKAGEEARVLPELPFKMAIVDRWRAVMPLQMDPPLTRGVLITGSTMVMALVELFERMWREALPVRPELWRELGDPDLETTDPEPPVAGLTPEAGALGPGGGALGPAEGALGRTGGAPVRAAGSLTPVVGAPGAAAGASGSAAGASGSTAGTQGPLAGTPSPAAGSLGPTAGAPSPSADAFSSAASALSLEDRRLLALLAAGLKDDAIARQLGTSPRTIRRRLRHLLDELNAETRFQAGAQASRRGLV
ncbi:helix-turn-helix domain-containing protein [Nonomuraea angiospora]|uniref:helix-turn-helix domain-containing protein n=1 Tax=Nonomuraea angiospora TaxID=46172 RepID=UPI00344ED56F